MPEKRGRKPKQPAPTKPAIAGKVGPTSTARPQPPSDLSGVALAMWGDLCDDLASLKLLAVADSHLLAVLRRIETQLAAEELTSVSPANRRVFINPLLASQSDYAGKVRQCLYDLGLTPRSRQTPTGQDEPDRMSEYLQGK